MNEKFEFAKEASNELEVQEKVARKMKKIFQRSSSKKSNEELKQVIGNNSQNSVNSEIFIMISKNHDHFKERDNLIESLLNELKYKLDQQNSLNSSRNILKRNNTSIYEIISALNSNIAEQKIILSDINSKIHESVETIKKIEGNEYLNVLKDAMEDLQETMIDKHEVFETKYSEIDDFLSKLKDSKKNGEEIALKIRQIEESKSMEPLDEENIVQNEESTVEKYQEIISEQLQKFQSSLKIKDDEIKNLDDKYRQCITKARDCKCFYSSWFNKKCKF